MASSVGDCGEISRSSQFTNVSGRYVTAAARLPYVAGNIIFPSHVLATMLGSGRSLALPSRKSAAPIVGVIT